MSNHRIIIAGSRTLTDYEFFSGELDKIFKEFNLCYDENVEIFSGGAQGTDYMGEQYAAKNDYKLRIFPALWGEYGKCAGFIRNSEMANEASHLIAFWDGQSRGTAHMIDVANSKDLEVQVIRYTIGDDGLAYLKD